MKICGNCGWLFIDRSKNKSRTWCDMAVCGNRAKANRHYQRREREERSHDAFSDHDHRTERAAWRSAAASARPMTGRRSSAAGSSSSTIASRHASYLITLTQESADPGGHGCGRRIRKSDGRRSRSSSGRRFSLLGQDHAGNVPGSIASARIGPTRSRYGSSMPAARRSRPSRPRSNRMSTSRVLAAKPLVVGPFYTKNPDIFKRRRTTPDFSPEHVCARQAT